GRLPRDLELLLVLEQRAQADPDQVLVVDEQHADHYDAPCSSRPTPATLATRRRRNRPHGLNTDSVIATAIASDAVTGGNTRSPADLVGPSARADRPASSTAATSGPSAASTSTTRTTLSTSLTRTHVYRTSPYFVPSPSSTPEASVSSPTTSSGSGANAAMLVAAAPAPTGSPATIVRTSRPRTRSIPSQDPAAAMCTRSAALRARAESRKRGEVAVVVMHPTVRETRPAHV